MATTVEFIEYVCQQINGVGAIRYKKMFGEYLVYIDEKPVLLVCDNTVYIKMLNIIKDDMKEEETGIPYKGSKEHYILDIENNDFSKNIINKILPIIPFPKKKPKK